VPLYSRALTTGLRFPETRRIVFLNNQPATLPGWAVLEVG
jgi:CRISPR-associated protein Csm5